MLSVRVKDFINRHLPQSPRVIVGLSGGADSVALLLSLRDAGAECIAAHCNFHLRGEESDRDQAYCETLCRQLGVQIFVKHFDVQARRAATSESVEMACRTLRYDWWRELIDSGEGDYLAVGHHREDNIETFFLNLLRGSGIAGLKGMLPVSGHIIRPMLEATRAEIEEYVTSRGYTWVNDRTNQENEYKRNRLRNILLPILEEEFHGASDAITRTLGILRQNYAVYNQFVKSETAPYISDDGSVDICGIIRNCHEPSVLLHELLPAQGLNHSQIDDIIRCVGADTSGISSGQRFITPDGTFTLEKGWLTKALTTDITEHKVDFSRSPFRAERISTDDFNKVKASGQFSSDVIYLDAAAFDGSPAWTWRTWRQGDRLQPFGMKGSRLVSDLYSDAKFTANQKHSTPLLFRDGVLIWVAGLRASNHFRVKASTTSVIKITFG